MQPHNERMHITLEPAPNGGWRILTAPDQRSIPGPHGAYTSTPDMLEALSTLLYIDLGEPPHAK